MKNKNIMNTVLPIIPMILWGSLFPFVKIGYNAFSIDTERIGDILMLAAMRFSVCGIIGCIIAFITGAKLEKPIGKKEYIKSLLRRTVFCSSAICVCLYRTDLDKQLESRNFTTARSSDIRLLFVFIY